MFELYLNGSTCDEIVKINNNQFTLGQVLEVRVRDSWDDKREKHLSDLYGGIREKVKQTQMEAVAFTSDLLAAAHKQYGQKLKRYLQSGDEKDLGTLSLSGLQSYQKAVDILMKLTGQDKKEAAAKISGPSAMEPSTNPANPNVVITPEKASLALPGATERVGPTLADRILMQIEKEDNE